MEIRIEPLDTLFFRDGKPFEKGQDTWADGTIIPNPTVLYGALRTAFATENGITFKELAEGKALTAEDFKVQGIYYRIGNVNFLPLPTDLVVYDKDLNTGRLKPTKRYYEVKPLRVVQKNIISSKENIDNHFLVSNDKNKKVEDLETGLIVITELEKYLNGELESTKAYKLNDHVQNEPKIGIGRDNETRTSEEGDLFRVDMKRSEDFQIGVSIDINKKYAKYGDLIRLGGETKMVQLCSGGRVPMRVIRKPIDFSTGYFKVYFSTPTILDDGLPTDLLLNKFGIKASLITATVGKPLHIGGFDMAKKRAKPMYKSIPAGSVFYYKAENDISLLNDNQGVAISDKLSEQGFGICYFGTWNIK
jgi:CRISPR-associated protein Cmr3